ncbi:MAG: 7-carboxy-7-deazaguanine synthase QueE [Kovacikia sp.]
MPALEIQLPIHETFQSTVQGEGYWSGNLVDFIRLSGCPVQCPWCDTGYSDGGKNAPRELRSLTSLIQELKSPRVVISGGEPFIHKQLLILVQALLEAGKQVNIETSGAFWQDLPAEVWITLSPKHHVSPHYPVQEAFWSRANEIKLVISTGHELDFYTPCLALNSHCPIYLQPEWSDRDRAIPTILNLLQQHPTYKLSLQTHKFIGVL